MDEGAGGLGEGSGSGDGEKRTTGGIKETPQAGPGGGLTVGGEGRGVEGHAQVSGLGCWIDGGGSY